MYHWKSIDPAESAVVEQSSFVPPPPPPPEAVRHSRWYLPVRAKFVVALVVACLWTMLSIWLARFWVEDLGRLTHPLIAIAIIGFIAFIPGFMNAFLISSLLMDRRPLHVDPAHWPGVSLLIPAYNEEDCIADTLASVAALRYPGPVEVLVINDGSTDATVSRVGESIIGLPWPANFSVQLVDFGINQGKANALNAALPMTSHELISTIDADSRPFPDALNKLVARLLSDPPETQAVAGAMLVGNPKASLMAEAQVWDYFHGIAAVKRMQSMYHGTLVAQGAFSVYRKAAVEEIGGWPDMVGEDIGLTWALLDRNHRIGYAEDALCWTTVPSTLKRFAGQRKRWARGMVEALEDNAKLFVRPRMTTLFIWWNLLFIPMDLVYTFVFIPGLILALLGTYWIAGPMTLLVLPLALL